MYTRYLTYKCQSSPTGPNTFRFLHDPDKGKMTIKLFPASTKKFLALTDLFSKNNISYKFHNWGSSNPKNRIQQFSLNIKDCRKVMEILHTAGLLSNEDRANIKLRVERMETVMALRARLTPTSTTTQKEWIAAMIEAELDAPLPPLPLVAAPANPAAETSLLGMFGQQPTMPDTASTASTHSLRS